MIIVLPTLYGTKPKQTMANHGFHSQASVLSSGGLPFQPVSLHLLRKSWTPSKQVSRCTKGPGGNRRAGLALVVFIVPPSGVKHGLGNPKSLNWTCLNGETHQTELGWLFSNPYYQGTDSYLSENLSWKVLWRDLCEQTGSSFHCQTQAGWELWHVHTLVQQLFGSC